MASANVVNVSVIRATRAQHVTAQNPMRIARPIKVFVMTVANVYATSVYVKEDTRGHTAKCVLRAKNRVKSQGKKTSEQVTMCSTKLPIFHFISHLRESLKQLLTYRNHENQFIRPFSNEPLKAFLQGISHILSHINWDIF